MLNEICFFPLIETVMDELGQAIESATYERMAFCQYKSTPQSEFFSAGQTGLKPECVLVVNTFEYQGERKVKYKKVVFDIYRTYHRSDERTELYCMVKSNG
jgi:SPP1 family predicted phage head-tail adaptor